MRPRDSNDRKTVIGTIARAVFFVLLPAIGVGGALGLPILLCLAGLVSLRPSLLRQAAESRPWSLLLLIFFLALAVASSLWSEHAAGAQALKVGALAALGLVFAAAAAQDPRLTRAGAIAAFAVLAALLAIEALGRLPLNLAAQPGGDFDELTRNVSRGASLLLVMTFATAGALLALWIAHLRLSPLIAKIVGWIGLAALVLLGVVVDVSQQFPGYLAGIPVFAALAFYYCHTVRSGQMRAMVILLANVTILS